MSLFPGVPHSPGRSGFRICYIPSIGNASLPNNAIHLSRHRARFFGSQTSLRPGDGKRSKDHWFSQTEDLGLRSCLWLIWLTVLGCASCQICGYRTRKPRPCLGGLSQRVLHRNGFADDQPDAAEWFSQMWDTRSMLFGTSQ